MELPDTHLEALNQLASGHPEAGQIAPDVLDDLRGWGLVMAHSLEVTGMGARYAGKGVREQSAARATVGRVRLSFGHRDRPIDRTTGCTVTRRRSMRFMVQALMNEVSESDINEMMALIPAQEALDRELIAQGVQEASAVVAADRSTAWKVMSGESKDEIEEIVRTFPLDSFSKWQITAVLSEEENTPS